MATSDAQVNEGRGFTIGAWVCAVIGFFFWPIALVGIILGFVGHRKGDPQGKIAAIVSAVLFVLGLLIGGALLASMLGRR